MIYIENQPKLQKQYPMLTIEQTAKIIGLAWEEKKKEEAKLEAALKQLLPTLQPNQLGGSLGNQYNQLNYLQANQFSSSSTPSLSQFQSMQQLQQQSIPMQQQLQQQSIQMALPTMNNTNSSNNLNLNSVSQLTTLKSENNNSSISTTSNPNGTAVGSSTEDGLREGGPAGLQGGLGSVPVPPNNNSLGNFLFFNLSHIYLNKPFS